MNNNRTTEDLRAILFKTIDDVVTGNIEYEDAKAVATLSDRIIQTAKLEIEFAKTTSILDSQEQGINIGPLLLTKDGS